VIDFDALASTHMHEAPYEWGLSQQALDPARAPALIDTFPSEDFWRIAGHDGEKSYTYSARPVVILGADRAANLSRLSDPWQELVADLLSPRYRESLGLAIGRPLDEALMEAAIWRWGHDAHLGPHLDMREKLVTQVFYLNAGWNPWWGGCLRILNSQDESDLAAEIEPILGNASILVRSDRSWHAVSAVAGTPVPRRSLIVTWLRPGNTSPTWYEDEDGTVRTFAEPPGAVREAEPELSGLAALEAHAASLDARCEELSAVRNRRSVRAALAMTKAVRSVREAPRRRRAAGPAQP
jgi:Rps23 Pro-64 3,4-dihydroxylase Tpa1-like proline 4-hydroxylase